LTPQDEPNQQQDQQKWCDCGWPYTLLLPRGTAAGMQFRLFVMLSNGVDLAVLSSDQGCTSASYCGVQDRDYPDSRPMGYPFNRPFSGEHGIADVINKQDNMAVRTIAIQCRNLEQSPDA
jgi:hypothetical protein